MKQVGLGLVGLAASLVFGFLGYRELEKFIYENGININLKLVALAVGIFLVAATVSAVLAMRKRRGQEGRDQ